MRDSDGKNAYFFMLRLENLGKLIIECPANNLSRVPNDVNTTLKLASSAKCFYALRFFLNIQAV